MKLEKTLISIMEKKVDSSLFTHANYFFMLKKEKLLLKTLTGNVLKNQKNCIHFIKF